MLENESGQKMLDGFHSSAGLKAKKGESCDSPFSFVRVRRTPVFAEESTPGLSMRRVRA